MKIQKAKYGFWQSPITAKLAAKGAVSYGRLMADADGGFYYNISELSQNNKKQMVLKKAEIINGEVYHKRVLKKGFEAKSNVHEYGGGEFFIAGEKLYFSNSADQQIYSMVIDGKGKIGKKPANFKPQQITNESNWRFCDGVLDKNNNQIICVAEKHEVQNIINDNENGFANGNITKHVSYNYLIAISLNEAEEDFGKIRILHDDYDFYSSPKINENSNMLAFMGWNLPFMPWECADIIIAKITAKGEIIAKKSLKDELIQKLNTSRKLEHFSLAEPKWHDDDLYFVSDVEGFGHIYSYRYNISDKTHKIISETPKIKADFSKPHWIFNYNTYAISSKGFIIASYIEKGLHKLAIIKDKLFYTLTTPYEHIEYIDISEKDDELLIALLSGSHKLSLSLNFMSISMAKISEASIDNRAFEPKILSDLPVEFEGYISKPEIMEFSTSKGDISYGLFYPPQNKDYLVKANEGELPPLIISLHGGPTAYADKYLLMKTQFWTSRGFAFLDLDYRGSYGYGKAYRDQLYGNWGDAEVEDMLAAISKLGKNGFIDDKKIFIKGSSAGGYSVLKALIKSDRFCAASSYYGVADLNKLQAITHKFEAGYLICLICGFEKANDFMNGNFDPFSIFEEKSPLTHYDKIITPIVFFQGGNDFVVPASQSREIYEKLCKNGINCKFNYFENEGHGFKNPETLEQCFKAEYEFFISYLKK